MPCVSDVKRAAKIVESYADDVCPFKTGIIEGVGKYFEFDPTDVVKILIQAYGLEDQARERSVRISQAIDGAQLSKRMTHVLYGLKMNDHAAICPLTKRPLLGNPDKECCQSRNACFPIKMIMGRETKSIYAHYKHLFDFFNAERSDARESIIDGAFMPLTVQTNADMSATWKGLGRGGAVKRDKFPCHCCSIQSKELVVPNAIRCSRWCAQYEADGSRQGHFHCHHKEFLCDDRMTEMQEELEEILNNLAGTAMQNIDDVICETKLRTDEDPRAPLASSLHEIFLH